MQGLLPAIVQDASSGEVLMLGFMNREAFEQTLQAGYVTFFSRTRNQLWTKGETSGQPAESGFGVRPTATATPCCCVSRSRAKAWCVTGYALLLHRRAASGREAVAGRRAR